MPTAHVFIATSLDGFIARHDGSIDWLLSRDDPNEDHGYQDFINDMDAIIMGRGSFEAASRFDVWPYELPVLVLSKTLGAAPVPQALQGRVTFADLAPRAAMERLGREGVGRVYVDGGKVVQAFLREGLIADMVITHIPVLLGTGRPLFGPTGHDIPLTLVETKAFPSGLVQVHYRAGAWRPVFLRPCKSLVTTIPRALNSVRFC